MGSLIGKLDKLVHEYVDDADAVMRDGEQKWGVEIIVADLVELCRRRGVDFRGAVAQGLSLHGQRTDGGVYQTATISP